MKQSVEKNAKTVDEAIALALEELQTTRDQVEVAILEENPGGFLGLGKSATVRVSKLEQLVDTGLPISENVEEEPSNYLDYNAQTPVEEVTVETSNVVLPEDETANQEAAQNVVETTDEEEELSEEEKLALASDAVEKFLSDILKSFHIDDVNELTMDVEDGRLIARIQGEDCGILIGRKGMTLRSIQYLSSLVANRTTRSRVRFTLDIGAYREKRQDSVADLAKRTAERAISTGQAYELTPMSAAERRIVHESLQDFEGITTYSEGDEPNRYVVIDLAYEDEEFSDEEI